MNHVATGQSCVSIHESLADMYSLSISRSISISVSASNSHPRLVQVVRELCWGSHDGGQGAVSVEVVCPQGDVPQQLGEGGDEGVGGGGVFVVGVHVQRVGERCSVAMQVVPDVCTIFLRPEHLLKVREKKNDDDVNIDVGSDHHHDNDDDTNRRDKIRSSNNNSYNDNDGDAWKLKIELSGSRSIIVTSD